MTFSTVFLGPPGCGKGTQSSAVLRALGENAVTHVSTGDLLRAEVAEGTPVGLEAKALMDKGALVPDVLVMKLLEKKLTGAVNTSCILDGFPRTVAQAEMLDVVFQKMGKPLDSVVFFDIDPEIVVKRICGRRTHLSSGRVYHVEFSPPKVEGLDDITGEALVQRSDDNEEACRKRLKTYDEASKPLVNHYDKRGLLHTVNAALDAAVLTPIIFDLLRIPSA